MLGLSHTTVSQALRNIEHVNIATRKRVQAAAKTIGYQSNPLAGLLMTQMRRRRGSAFQASLAIVDLDGPKDRSLAATVYHNELAEGASERAGELGFRVNFFSVSDRGAPTHQINLFLHANQIQGVLFLPTRNISTLAGHDWSRYSCVYADYAEGDSMPHTICPDHIGAMRVALNRLYTCGYRRPGLVLDQGEERRLFGRWSNGFRMLRTSIGFDEHPQIPPLLMASSGCGAFPQWFEKYKPDVVIGHGAEIMNWMRACGAKIPKTHGFCCLNVTKNPDHACAGLDLQPCQVGARGVELVMAQLQRGEFGVPPQPLSTSLVPAWVPGPTLNSEDCAVLFAELAISGR